MDTELLIFALSFSLLFNICQFLDFRNYRQNSINWFTKWCELHDDYETLRKKYIYRITRRP